MTDTAVVILNFNGCSLLQKFLPSVIHFSEGARIVVVDNGSTDHSIKLLTDDFPGIERIRIETNLGFCGGYNFALKQIQATYYVLLNSDVEVTRDWLLPLHALLDRIPAAATVQPKILSHRLKGKFEYAGAGGGLLDSLGYPFCRGRLFYFTEEDLGQYNDEREIFWSSGACMMVRSSLFHTHGGFDEDFFAHMEEIDLCWRLQRAGHSIYYAGTSCVYHVGGGTLSAANPRKTYLNFKNGLSLLFKNMPMGELLIKFPVRLVLDWIASLKFALSGSVRDGLSVWKAHLHFFAHWGREVARRKLSSETGFAKPVNRYRGSIVWDFFILGKRKFTQLRD